MNGHSQHEPERSLRAYASVVDEAIARGSSASPHFDAASSTADGVIRADHERSRRRFINGPSIAAIGIAASFLAVTLWAVNRSADDLVESATVTDAVTDEIVVEDEAAEGSVDDLGGQDAMERDEAGEATVDSARMDLTVFIYSGLPNPVLNVTVEEAEGIRDILDTLALDAVESQVRHPDGLGFGGFQLEHYVFDGDERVVHVSDAGVTLHPVGQGAFSVDGESVALSDPEGTLYEQLRSIVDASLPDVSGGLPEFSG